MTAAALTRFIAPLQRARKAFDGRARRERVLLLAVVLALGLMLADTLWVTPAFKAWGQARTRHAAATAALMQLNNEVARQGAEQRAAEQQLRQDVAQLRERVRAADSALHGSALIPAADMLPVLDRLLTQVGGLRLRSMQSLGRVEVAAGTTAAAAVVAPAASSASAAATTAAPAGPVLYRHGVELAIEGSYADLLAYLKAIEEMPQQVLWGGVQLKVEQHPKAVLTLRLYTLSLDRTWLEI